MKAQVRSFLTTNWGLTYQGMWAVTRFVRAPATDAQRIEALNALMSEVAPPLRPDVVALAPAAASRADWVATNFLKNLFLAEAWARDEIATPPALWDPAFASQIAGLAKDILTNRDQVRSYSSRMAMVDVLKEMQSAQAYQALLAARAALVTDVANSPYFR